MDTPNARPRRPAALFLVALCLGASACERMESRGDPFATVPAEAATEAVTERAAAGAPTGPTGGATDAAGAPGTPGSGAGPTDPAFDFPDDPPVLMTSEQLAAAGDAGLAAAGRAAAGTAGATGAAAAVGVPAPVQWPVRLVSTLPAAQPPRAILGLPDGEERVVSPGSMLPEQGLVVMAVSGDRVQLARVEPAGDHARIVALELSSQYPSGR